MRRTPLLVLTVLVLAPALVLLADEPPAGAPAVTQTTEVVGSPPDLTGRWFVVADLALPEEKHLSVTHFWDIATVDGTVRIDARQVGLPPDLKAAFDDANRRSVSWDVSGGELDEIRAQWTTLPAEDRGVASIEHRLIGKDGFDEMIQNEALMQNALWVLQQSAQFRPNEGRPVREVLLWGALEPTADGFTGNHMSVAVAAAPFPIPISFKGTFRMYRMDGASERGFLARLLDVFAGCGRSR